MKLLHTSLRQYRSSVYEIARLVLKSRHRLAQQTEQLERENLEARDEVRRLQEQLDKTNLELAEKSQLLEKEKQENQRLKEQPIYLHPEAVVPGHHYGPKMICICLQLVQKLGLRPSERALKIVFKFFRIKDEVPSWDSMRCWRSRSVR